MPWLKMRLAAFVITGALLVPPARVASAVNLLPGDILVVDAGSDAVFKVDPVTAIQTPISMGGVLQNPQDILLRPNGDLLVTDPGTRSIYRINPDTGAQTPVFTNLDSCWIENDFGRVLGVSPNGIHAFNLDTGAITPFSTGGLFVHPLDIAISHDGEALVIDPEGGRIVAVNLASGQQRQFVEAPTATCWLEVGVDGRIYASGPGGVFEISRDGRTVTPITPGSALDKATDLVQQVGGPLLVGGNGVIY